MDGGAVGGRGSGVQCRGLFGVQVGEREQAENEPRVVPGGGGGGGGGWRA